VTGTSYHIDSSTGTTTRTAGIVVDTLYFDATTGNPYNQSSLYDSGSPSRCQTLGTAPGNDYDAVLGIDGAYHTFGLGGRIEATTTAHATMGQPVLAGFLQSTVTDRPAIRSATVSRC